MARPCLCRTSLRRTSLRLTSLRLISLALTGLALACGCSGSQGGESGVALAENTDIQSELRALEQRWELTPRPQRGELRADLEKFIERAGTDPSSARGRLMLARIWLDEGQSERVEQTIRPILAGQAGRTRDEAEVLMAAVERRRGQSEKAFERLAALDGKLFSVEARELALLERIQASLALRRWRAALDGVVGWLVLRPRLSKQDEAWVRGLVAEIPVPALSIVLADYSEQPPSAEQKPARDWLERAIIELLTREALEKQDARLARELLAHSPIWLRTSEAGDELSILASQAGEAASVAGRVVGIVLGGQSLGERTRSVRVVGGLLEGLGLGRGGDDSVRVIVEEDRGSLATSLASLSGQGALLLIAGATDEGAAAALRFAEARQIPVVTIAAPSAPVEGGDFGFVFGEDEARQIATLEQALREREREPWARVGGGGGVECELSYNRPGMALFPVTQWSRDGIRSLVLLGDAACARRLERELGDRVGQYWLGLGLEAAEVRLDARQVLRLEAGQFGAKSEAPAAGGATTSGAASAAPGASSGASGSASLAMRRGWYEVLGGDLARLSRAVLAELPATAAQDEREVRARHLKVRDALLRVRVDLESSEAKGFAGKRRLTRQLRVVATEGK
ncbi:MAG TPA: hypothetical protein VLC09_00875 [Polyangiaceae bacterium]|nr:hypothetical protein [Polyangiaceae bacterium]